MTPPSPRIRPGSRVTLHLSICLEDGTEALSSLDGDPLEFTIGDGTLAAGLETLLFDLPVNSDTQILAEGAAVFGPVDADLVHDLPWADLPPGLELAPGQVVAFDTPGGHETPGTVVEVDDTSVRVDFNHPLARRGLRIRVQVLAVG